MSIYANDIVRQAEKWIGKNEKDGSYKEIIDIYNSHTPLARGYRMTTQDAWCAAFVSAVAIKCGATNIIPTECSCIKMIELFQKLGCWIEDDAYVPSPGMIVFYDWQDSGVGDCKGAPDHVGIVEAINGDIMTIIEGNYSNAVKRRVIKVNSKFIRGYGLPNFESKATEKESINTTSSKEMCSVELKVLKQGSKGNSVRALQLLLIGNNCSCGSSGADGDFGSATLSAVKKYQAKKGLEVDGIVGKNTWTSLLK